MWTSRVERAPRSVVRTAVFFVANSYGDYWDSYYEKLEVPVHNQRVPVQKHKESRLGLYVTRQLIWRQTPNRFIAVH